MANQEENNVLQKHCANIEPSKDLVKAEQNNKEKLTTTTATGRIIHFTPSGIYIPVTQSLKGSEQVT